MNKHAQRSGFENIAHTNENVVRNCTKMTSNTECEWAIKEKCAILEQKKTILFKKIYLKNTEVILWYFYKKHQTFILLEKKSYTNCLTFDEPVSNFFYFARHYTFTGIKFFSV